MMRPAIEKQVVVGQRGQNLGNEEPVRIVDRQVGEPPLLPGQPPGEES